MSPEAERVVREFARSEVTDPPWFCDPLGPDAVCRMWLKVAQWVGVHVRDLDPELQTETHALYRAEVKRLTEAA